ncbi:MAG TPA: hypothetical protein P5572_17420, partial [Phycisphaerae bacterium]|nr:hypothetical protein [Phycisphaerae bacterium]
MILESLRSRFELAALRHRCCCSATATQRRVKEHAAFSSNKHGKVSRFRDNHNSSFVNAVTVPNFPIWPVAYSPVTLLKSELISTTGPANSSGEAAAAAPARYRTIVVVKVSLDVFHVDPHFMILERLDSRFELASLRLRGN